MSAGLRSWSEEITEKNARDINFDPHDYRLVMTLHLASELMGAPRHPGQHDGGFVLTRSRLEDLVPITSRCAGFELDQHIYRDRHHKSQIRCPPV
jgi:error-prone DNA polymerase